jgi:hypothetical protein
MLKIGPTHDRGTIIGRTRKDGSKAFTAQIVIKKAAPSSTAKPKAFEMGKTIPQAAAASGHRSWSSLKRYTHIRQTGDKYANWKWQPFY